MANNRLWKNWKIVASGYAAIWAEENTRASLFDAMKRREVYATTGSRIKVRFFGGWNYKLSDVEKPTWVDIGYTNGVPMGGDLLRALPEDAPTFIVFAAKDPDGANLDRIQVVKGWLDNKGNLHEKIYDVAWSGNREIDNQTGRLGLVGSTVDIDNASYDNSVGASNLLSVWEDPDFNAKERSFYYLRVLEIPKPRWTAYDAKFFGLSLPAEIPMTVQDRAYTSPIWYTP